MIKYPHEISKTRTVNESNYSIINSGLTQSVLTLRDLGVQKISPNIKYLPLIPCLDKQVSLVKKLRNLNDFITEFMEKMEQEEVDIFTSIVN